MSNMTSDASLSYPIGGPRKAESFTPQERSAAIEGIRQLPRNLRSAIAGWAEEQLETPYRPGGWTVRQLVHHVADSHMNAYNRVRLALTEDWPVIFAYQENRWAELEDARSAAVSTSLDLLDALHVRWVRLFSSLHEQTGSAVLRTLRTAVSPSNKRSSSTTGMAATTPRT
jgi:DinB superfamily